MRWRQGVAIGVERRHAASSGGLQLDAGSGEIATVCVPFLFRYINTHTYTHIYAHAHTYKHTYIHIHKKTNNFAVHGSPISEQTVDYIDH